MSPSTIPTASRGCAIKASPPSPPPQHVMKKELPGVGGGRGEAQRGWVSSFLQPGFLWEMVLPSRAPFLPLAAPVRPEIQLQIP